MKTKMAITRNTFFITHSHFDDNLLSISIQSFQIYLSNVQAYMVLLENAVESRLDKTSHKIMKKFDLTEFNDALQSLIGGINENYNKTLSGVKYYIERLEDENERYM